MIGAHEWVDIGTRTIVICSLLYTFLPPWEIFNDFPAVQKYYKLLLAIVAHMAIAGRSSVYRSIKNGKSDG
jgi:hypothetical protein